MKPTYMPIANSKQVSF